MNPRKHILISTSTFGLMDSSPLKKLKKIKIPIKLNPYGRRLNPEEVLNLTKNAVGILAGTEKLSADVLSEAVHLKVISRCGSGLDSVDVQAAQNLGIQVYFTPFAPRESVAELTLAHMLNSLRHVSEAMIKLREGVWKPIFGNLLYGKNVGIVGLGRVGKKVVELLKPFNVQILAFENRPQASFIKKHNIKLMSLKTLLSKSDVVSLHLSIDRTTNCLIGKKQISWMKKGAVLVNTARGELIDEKALYQALESGHLGGVGLDVFSNEPYQGPLLKSPHALLTPHLGSYSKEARIDMEKEAADNLIEGLKKSHII